MKTSRNKGIIGVACAVSVLTDAAGSTPSLADEYNIEIRNYLDEDLSYDSIEVRQLLQIKSDPPSVVKGHGGVGEFKIADGDGSAITAMLEVKYCADIVEFGIANEGCFIRSSSSAIHGEHHQCDKHTKIFSFSKAGE